MYTLTTLGGLSIVGPGGIGTPLTPRKRALALLTLAASSAKEGISRDRAMAILWPELNTASARNNLKQTVFGIRQALGVSKGVALNFSLASGLLLTSAALIAAALGLSALILLTLHARRTLARTALGAHAA